MTKSSSRTARAKRTEDAGWERARTIGLDLGDRSSQCCGIDDRGEIVMECGVPTNRAAFEKALKAMGPKLVAIETGTHSPWVSRLLESFGHRVIVANSRKLRFIYKNRRKDDRVDARSLARVRNRVRNRTQMVSRLSKSRTFPSAQLLFVSIVTPPRVAESPTDGRESIPRAPAVRIGSSGRQIRICDPIFWIFRNIEPPCATLRIALCDVCPRNALSDRVAWA